jgi:type IV pilus assembly protein PilA
MSMLARPPKKREAGFTLIELMIAIAIIGVLAAIAVPAFSNYLARARVSEAIQYAESCKTGYIEFYATRGTLPTTVSEANCPSVTTNNVASVTISTNPPSIQVTLSGAGSALPTAIQSNVIVLQPLTSAGARMTAGQTIGNWLCALRSSSGAASSAAMDLVPAICRNATI